MFSIVNRSCFNISNTPLLSSRPHELVPSIELQRCGSNLMPELDGQAERRWLLATHIPYPALPESIPQSGCHIIYICRNPLDTVISSWYFFLSMERLADHPEWSLEEHCENYCQGEIACGPLWEHMVGYWNESLERPRKVLFLKYEDFKGDFVGQVKKVAEFVGLPFAEEEEEGGVIEELVKMCRLNTLKDLEVNRSGKLPSANIEVEKRSFFRKGEVGDWVNHLTPSMANRLNSIMYEKISPFGLQFMTH